MGLVRYLMLAWLAISIASVTYAQSNDTGARAPQLFLERSTSTDSLRERPLPAVAFTFRARETPLELRPEPLIGIHYLATYPAEAAIHKIEGVVRFTATIRSGHVTDLRIDRSTHELLSKAVLESARLLEFDLSWHAPDKPEFTYSREVSFTLPDNITARP
jgi:outer membrane biosynthesis protein TonB